MNIWAVITPIILTLLVAEIIFCVVKDNGYYNFQDTIANISTAVGNQCVNLVVGVVVFFSYGWIYENFSITQFETNGWTMALLLLIIDFLFYWFHRIGHTVNVFWAAHMPHHSSEEMNLAVGLRASVTQRLFSFTFFWPLPILGFSPEQIYTMAAIHLLNGFWHHTRVIPKLGWFEKFFNTPSHHRVHHGTNTQYMDKNYAELFIIWDRIFGTFEEEVEPVCYGVTHPPRSWDPTNIYFQFWKQLWEDCKETNIWWDKIRLWFMPLGWRPRDLAPYPDIGVGVTLDQQVKYESRAFKNSKPYLIAHTILGILFMYLAIETKNPLTGLERFEVSLLVFTMITSFGGIMESRRWAPFLEQLRLVCTAALTYYLGQKYFGWTIVGPQTIAVLATTGISLLWCGINFRRPLTEDERQKLWVEHEAKMRERNAANAALQTV